MRIINWFGQEKLVAILPGVRVAGAIQKFQQPVAIHIAVYHDQAGQHGDILGFSPPLIVTESDIDEIVERVARGIARGFDELKREGKLR